MGPKWGQAIAEELIGMISHYLRSPQVGIVKLTAGFNLGDTLRLGHGAEFQQTVTSMQLDHVAVGAASPGTEVKAFAERRGPDPATIDLYTTSQFFRQLGCGLH